VAPIVMSRVQFAVQHQSLTDLIRRCLGGIVADLGRGREGELREIVLVGNTAMHHLFAGVAVEPLSHVPFASPNLADADLCAARSRMESAIRLSTPFLAVHRRICGL
jgi:uncharacterized 2Fe-2S/4Fe-4S cluster protein (DUF4445 family)